MNIKKTSLLNLKLIFITLFPIVCSCSTAEFKSNKPNSSHSTTEDPQKLLIELSNRVQALESKLASLDDKINATRPLPDFASNTKQKSSPTEVITHPAADLGTPIITPPLPHDPEIGFIHDDAVESYRKSMILFQGQTYPEAILSFSDFMEKFPDHILAGSAQFYIGESYLKQKEYKLAIQEFQRVLSSYDRSSHIADTLHEIASAEDSLKQTREAAGHRQLLTSLFPHSPAAWVTKNQNSEVFNQEEAKPKELKPEELKPEESKPEELQPEEKEESLNSNDHTEGSRELDHPPFPETPPTAPLDGHSEELPKSLE